MINTDLISDLRDCIDDIGVYTAIWEMRHEPDAQARRCASMSVDAIDKATWKLYELRNQLIDSIRQADDAATARVDALLARTAGGDR